MRATMYNTEHNIVIKNRLRLKDVKLCGNFKLYNIHSYLDLALSN